MDMFATFVLMPVFMLVVVSATAVIVMVVMVFMLVVMVMPTATVTVIIVVFVDMTVFVMLAGSTCCIVIVVMMIMSATAVAVVIIFFVVVGAYQIYCFRSHVHSIHDLCTASLYSYMFEEFAYAVEEHYAHTFGEITDAECCDSCDGHQEVLIEYLSV